MPDEGLDQGRARALQAKAARDAGRHAEAIAAYREAAESARRDGDLLALAHRLRHIGDIHLEDDRIDLAAPLYDESLALYRSRDDVPALDLANLLRPLALLSAARNQPEAARRYWTEALALYRQAGVGAGVDECTRHLEAL
jgi:tetratricopeptide (TPR) repeat protein